MHKQEVEGGKAALEVSSDFTLDLPCPERPSNELEPADTTRGLLVRVFVETHVILDNRDHVILACDDGASREREELVGVVRPTRHRGDELVVDPNRGREDCVIELRQSRSLPEWVERLTIAAIDRQVRRRLRPGGIEVPAPQHDVLAAK